MALCTQADVEIRLQRDLTADPPAITGTVDGLIADAQAHIEDEVGRTLESGTHDQVFDGGRPALWLRNWPVTAITAVSEDGTALSSTDYAFKSNGRLIRLSGGYQTLWRTYKPQSIEVEYIGGYTSPTHDPELEHLGSICADMVARAILKGADAAALPAGAAGAVQSVSIEGSDSVTYATGGGEDTITGGLAQFVFLTEDEIRQLQGYKRYGFGFA